MRTRAEVEKLARALGTDPERLAALEACAPDDVRALRHAVADTLFEAGRRHFARAAAAAKVLPAALAAKLGEHALGPLLAARTVALLDPGQAHDLARRSSPCFLADVAVHLDPRHADEMIAGLPAGLIAAAAAELERRGERVAMGTFVGHLGDDALAATVDVLSDDALLHVGFLLEAPERLDAIVAGLPDARVTGIIEIAMREGRWTELVGIAEHLGPEQVARVVALGEEVGARKPLAAAARRDPALRAAAAPLLRRRRAA
jgi:hypothetical protein